MLRVHVLDTPDDERSPYSPASAFWYPVSLNRRQLADLGIQVEFFVDIVPALTDCDVVLLSSRSPHLKRGKGGKNGPLLETLGALRDTARRIIWFDQRDSSGNTQFEVLPFVDKYLKKQLLKERTLYRLRLYGNRVYTHYFHQEHGIQDDADEDTMPLPEGTEGKLGLSWNIGLTDFRSDDGSVRRARRVLQDAVEKTFKRGHHLSLTPCDSKRDLDLVALFNVRYGRNTVSHQRRLALALLRGLERAGIVAGSKRVPGREFAHLLSRAKMTLSLFGWGEICYREFEAFIAGSAVLMPDVTHLETWPEFHVPFVTYWPLKWDMSDLVDAYHHLIRDDTLRLELARRGQNTYRQMWSFAGREMFCVRFKQMIEAPRFQRTGTDASTRDSASVGTPVSA